MRIKLLWDGNPEGTRRVLPLEGLNQQIWIFVERADGKHWPDKFSVDANARLTWIGQMLAPLLKALRVNTEANIGATCSGDDHYFMLGPLPSWPLPFWLDVTIELKASGTPATEKASVYVVPAVSRRISVVCLALTALLVGQLSWSLLSITSETPNQTMRETLATVGSILGPLVGVIAPFVSPTVRRATQNALWTGAGLLASLGLVLYFQWRASPVWILNGTPAELDFLKAGPPLDPGEAALVALRSPECSEAGGGSGGRPATDSLAAPGENGQGPESARSAGHGRSPHADTEAGGALDTDLEGALRCQNVPDDPAKNQWFSRNAYCLVTGDDPRCKPLRSASWYASLLKLLTFGDSVVIGCKIPRVPERYLAEWRRGSKCQPEAETNLDLGLGDFVSELKARSEGFGKGAERGDAASADVSAGLEPCRGFRPAPDREPHPWPGESCQLPEGEVRLLPFARGTPEPKAGERGPCLAEFEVEWPDSVHTASLPNWSVLGEGFVRKVTLTPPESVAAPAEAAGEKQGACGAPYRMPCRADKDDTCSALLAPPGELSVTFSRAGKDLGTLWCSTKKQQRVIAARADARVRGLRIVSGDSSTEVNSTFDALAPALVDWVFWCEPIERPPQAWVGELSVTKDFQPDARWTLEIPELSILRRFVVHVEDVGRWGTLDCRKDRARELQFWEMKSGAFIKTAEQPHAGWERYSEATRFPLWAMSCDDVGRRTGPLQVELGDGKNGSLDRDRIFTASRGRPCLIEKTSGRRLRYLANHDRYPISREAGNDVLKYRISGCDPRRAAYCTDSDCGSAL